MIFRTFGWSFFFTILGVVGALLYGGVEGVALALILIVLEISLSFDNAVVNAKVLERMSDFWQKMFLTVGILIAVFGMRLVFPFLVVALAASLSPVEVIDLALEKGDPDTPGTYGYYLADAHHTIAAFGGMFLLMIFLNFIFEEKDITWLSWIERPLEKAGKIDALSIIVALAVLFGAAQGFGGEHEGSVMTAGLAGLLTYLVVNGLAEAFGPDEEELEHLGEDANGNVMKVPGLSRSDQEVTFCIGQDAEVFTGFHYGVLHMALGEVARLDLEPPYAVAAAKKAVSCQVTLLSSVPPPEVDDVNEDGGVSSPGRHQHGSSDGPAETAETAETALFRRKLEENGGINAISADILKDGPHKMSRSPTFYDPSRHQLDPHRQLDGSSHDHTWTETVDALEVRVPLPSSITSKKTLFVSIR